ncbi:MAG: Gfo/Idh/MocA family oxidoreductase [Verrucomicrobiales bacterium]|nr:Gfo/Idh/MocA family oxidoreductase [Verrucomicrobiales bacterium]
MNRRSVLGCAGTAALLAPYCMAEGKKYRVGVIGHTGRGNFGHGLDTVWKRIPETEIVAVADADSTGLEKARRTLGIDSGFSDYRRMLSETKPNLVAVCPRQPDQHAEMILAAIDAGAKGIYVEKPFVRTLQEADEITAACKLHGTKIAVAHRNRYRPEIADIDQILGNEGERKIGRLLEIRGRGKGDRRGGAEDLWVLGTHVLDLVSRFAGKPLSCSASIYKDGKPVVPGDIIEGNEALGPLAGDEIHARYRMENGVTAFWDSIANDETKSRGFGLQLIGSEGVVIIHCDGKPLAHYRKGNPFDYANQSRWESIGNQANEKIDEARSHVLPCRDLIGSIEENRQPVCGLAEATITIEMVMGVFKSHFSGGIETSLPLSTRSHPLKDFK